MDFYLYELTVLAAVSISLRLIWCFVCRPLGLWHPGHYRLWLWFPWRTLVGPLYWLLDWYSETFRMGRRATGGWSDLVNTMRLVFQPGQIYAGRLRALGFALFQPLGLNGPRHFMMVAGAGSGKSTLLTTQLALWEGNSFLIDPDGQITRVLRKRRGKRLLELNPYAFRRGNKSGSWNPFEVFHYVEERWGLDACLPLAEQFGAALIQTRGRDPYWDETSRNFLVALILFVYVTERDAARRNLVSVRRLLMAGYGGKDGFDLLLNDMQRLEAFGGVISARATEVAEHEREMRGKTLSSARTQTAWLDNPKVQETLVHSDFRLADLKTGNLDLRLCAPVGAIQGELAPWFRLITILALDLFEMIPGSPKDPCLFALDEMPALGRIEKLEAAAPVLRKFGVRLLVVTQDLGWLKQAYPQSWEGFIGNAEAIWFMGINHHPTAEYLSKTLGKHVFKAGRKDMPGHERPVMDTEQVMRFLNPKKRNAIITRFADRPLKVKSGPYFSELPVWLVGADPDHRETLGRRLGRRLIRERQGQAARQTKASPSDRSPKEEIARFRRVAARFHLSLPAFSQDVPSILVASACSVIVGLMLLLIVLGPSL